MDLVRRGVLLTVVAAVGVMAATSDSSRAARATAGSGTTASAPPTATLAEILRGLRTRSPSGVPYDRQRFEHWTDEDGDGCDTRREVLIARSITPVQIGDGCTLTGGTWVSPYDGVESTASHEIHVDHLVALAEAWRSGAWNWTDAERSAYANDLDVPYALVAVSGRSNRSKGDRDPASWMPPLASYACAYLTAWILVKYRWRLSVDAAERAAIEDGLDDCGSSRVEVPARKR